MQNRKVVSTNISKVKGDSKQKVPAIEIDERGVVGDVHAGVSNRQISILGQESIDAFNLRTKHNIKPGDFAENLTISGVDLRKAALLDRLQIGQVVLEITQLGKKCHGDVCAIFREVGQCAMPKEGVFARVLHGGKITPGDTIIYQPKTIRILIITLSDRASHGEYVDKSGPAARELVENFFATTRFCCEVITVLMPDDAEELLGSLKRAIADKYDIIFTLGGTGVGPRDITPEVVAKICPKIIPGIMENIRIKYSKEYPAALLSRSIAGIINTTQIYTLPGSVRAVTEYLNEIFKTLEHTIYMLYGLDVHG